MKAAYWKSWKTLLPASFNEDGDTYSVYWTNLLTLKLYFRLGPLGPNSV